MKMASCALASLFAFNNVSAFAAEDSVFCDPETIDVSGAFICDFDVAMIESTDVRIVQANFTLPAAGAYRDINMDFFRNDSKVFDMSTFGVTFVPEGDSVRLKISTWDLKNKKAEKYTHRVVGKLYLSPITTVE